MQHWEPAGLIALCALLGACGGGQPGGSPPPGANQHAANAALPGAGAVPPMAQSDTAEFHHDDPCSLLTVAEVEAALGARLGTPPYRGSSVDPEPDGSDCVYLTRNFQTVTFSVEFEGGQQAYHVGDFVGNLLKGSNRVMADKAKKMMVSDDGSEIAGEWDEAKLTPLNCCDFSALRADQMIDIDFTGSTMTLKQAAGLVDAAFKRIDKPLALDGGANVAAARTFLKTRPQPKPACSVLTQAEVEAILGKLAVAPKQDTDTCTYELPRVPGHLPRIYELVFGWHDGNYSFRQDLHVAGIAGAATGGIRFQVQTQVQIPAASTAGSAGRPPPGGQTREGTETLSVDEAAKRMTGETFSHAMHMTGEQGASTKGPWERSATVGPNFEAIKHDVLVKMGLVGVDHDRARELVAAAMKKF